MELCSASTNETNELNDNFNNKYYVSVGNIFGAQKQIRYTRHFFFRRHIRATLNAFVAIYKIICWDSVSPLNTNELFSLFFSLLAVEDGVCAFLILCPPASFHSMVFWVSALSNLSSW